MFNRKINLLICSISILVSLLVFKSNSELKKYMIIFFEIFISLENIFNINLNSKNFLSDYDYIIVGAGTAGNLIASNLIKNSNVTVIILEAGNFPSAFQKIPALSPLFHQTQFDWNYKTEPQQNACGAMKNNQCNFALGKGLGGSNLINNMVWHRGLEADYKNWFQSSNWNFSEHSENLFIKLEDKLKPSKLKFISKLGQILSDIKSTVINFKQPLLLQKSGKRFTTYDYAKQTTNSHIKFLPNALVHKINLVTKNSLQASGVTFESKHKNYTITSKKGVILSAGTIGSPKILLQSGIGPCNELEKLNIKCHKNISSIGRNLQDHVGTAMSLIQYNESLNMNIENLLQINSVFKYFNPFNFGNGPLSTVGCELLGLSNDNKIGFMFMPVDVTSDGGVKLRHVMNIKDGIWENYFEKLLNVQTLSIIPFLLHPKSKGSVKLKINAKGEYQPVINPQYMIEKEDIEELKRGIMLIKKFLLTIKDIYDINMTLVGKLFPGCEHLIHENDYWNCYLKHNSFGLYHPVGTCKMGSDNFSDVVDYSFKVYNIDKLFIVDASVMPNLPSGNPNAAVALLAEHFSKIHAKN